jgi:hypothetical protein
MLLLAVVLAWICENVPFFRERLAFNIDLVRKALIWIDFKACSKSTMSMLAPQENLVC